MTKENKFNTVVFFNLNLFCSVWNDVNGLYEDEKAIARYLNVPEENVLNFALAFATSWNELFLNKAESEKKFTRENVAEIFSKTRLGTTIKTLGVTSEQVVQAMERAKIYTYNKLENYSEVLSTLEYLYEKGYNLILRDDKPESILKEAMKKMGFLKYFSSIQGMYDRYRTFTVKSMNEIIGEKDPKEFVLVTGGCPKRTLEVAKQMGILTVSTIAELKEIL